PPAPITEAEPPPPPEPVIEPLTPAHLEGSPLNRVGLLLPLSAQSRGVRDVAESLLNAAELAVFALGDPDLVLIPKDTGGARAGGAAAAEAVLDEGAAVLVGPLFAEAVQGAAEIAGAREAPVLAFSTDPDVAGDGVYLVSFTAEAEVGAVVDFAVSQGLTRFAFLGPRSAFGASVLDALTVKAAQNGASVTVSLDYLPNGDMRAAAQALAARQDSFDAVVLPEYGLRLRELAALLPFYDVDPAVKQVMTLGLWGDLSVAREPALAGAWFPAPDPLGREPFESAYNAAINRPPPRLAGLAYDAVTLAHGLFDDFRSEESVLGEGVFGVDGGLRIGPDGLPERRLAIFSVSEGRFVLHARPGAGGAVEASDVAANVLANP
ncbi:MAG: penicillin-binding protein activator, partial [Maricaulaceae bacterium]